jgi:acetoacetate decarboxylase
MTPSYWPRLLGMLSPGANMYDDAHYLVADMEIDPVVARRFVPSPLRVAKPAMASVFTGFFPKNTFGSVYREAGIFIHVEHGRTRAIFSPWMLVDDDVALILGRELLGYPKKMGEIDWAIDGDNIRGIASRRGAELISMEGTLGERVTNPPPMLGRPHRNVRSSLGLALPKVLAFTPHETPIEVRHAKLSVKISGSERDPLSDLGFGRVLRSYLHRVNIAARGLPIPIRTVSPLWYMRQWLLRAH